MPSKITTVIPRISTPEPDHVKAALEAFYKERGLTFNELHIEDPNDEWSEETLRMAEDDVRLNAMSAHEVPPGFDPDNISDLPHTENARLDWIQPTNSEMLTADLVEMRSLVRSAPGPTPCAVPGLQGILAHPPGFVTTEVTKFTTLKQRKRQRIKNANGKARDNMQHAWNRQRWAYVNAGGLESEAKACVVTEMSMQERAAADTTKQAKLAAAAAKKKELADARKAKADAAAAARKQTGTKRKADALTEEPETPVATRKSARTKKPTDRGLQAAAITPATPKTPAAKGRGRGKSTTKLPTPVSPEQMRRKPFVTIPAHAEQKLAAASTSMNDLTPSPPADVRMSIDFMLSSATPGGSMSNKLLTPSATLDDRTSNNVVDSGIPRDNNDSTDLASDSMNGGSTKSLSVAQGSKRRRVLGPSAVGAATSNTHPPTSSSSGSHVPGPLPSGTSSDTTKSLTHTPASSKSTIDTPYISSSTMAVMPDTMGYVSDELSPSQAREKEAYEASLRSAYIAKYGPSTTNDADYGTGSGYGTALTPARSSAPSTTGFPALTSSPPSVATPAKKPKMSIMPSIEVVGTITPFKSSKSRQSTPYISSTERKRKRADGDESSSEETFDGEAESDEEYAVVDTPASKKVKRTASGKSGGKSKAAAEQSEKTPKKAPTVKIPKTFKGISSRRGYSTVSPGNHDLKRGEQWRCGHLACKSGMTWYNDEDFKRKAISNFFGRNKTATKRIDNNVWHILCRKCYQEEYTYDTRKPETVIKKAEAITELIQQQLERIKLWRPDATFTFALHKSAVDRKNNFTTLLAQHGDIETAKNAMPPIAKSKSQSKPIVEEMFPVEYSVDFTAKFLGDDNVARSFEEVEEMLQWSLERVGKNKSPCITPFEILLNEEVKAGPGVAGEVVNDTKDNFKQWEKLQAEKRGETVPESDDDESDDEVQNTKTTAKKGKGGAKVKKNI